MRCITFALAGVLFPLVASADPALGIRDGSTSPPTDYTCEVEMVDDFTCELTCDGPNPLAFECLCDADLCECVDQAANGFTMEPDPDEGAWCDQLRRGGGHWCTPHGCEKLPPPSPECAPCLYGCTDTSSGPICNP